VKRRLALAAGLALVAGSKAPAQEPSVLAAEEVSALFLLACLPFAGRPTALRAWAGERRLPVLSAHASRLFLLDAPGLVFDASTPGTKLVLVSGDDGLCSAIAQAARGDIMVRLLEERLRAAEVTFRLVIERADKTEAAIVFREYLARGADRAWRILLAITREGGPGRVMLTAGVG
jgi:hypothetical protein